jgi:hypothetical protein
VPTVSQPWRQCGQEGMGDLVSGLAADSQGLAAPAPAPAVSHRLCIAAPVSQSLPCRPAAARQAMEKLAASKSWADMGGPDGGVSMSALLNKQ